MANNDFNGITCFTLEQEVAHSALSDSLNVLMLDSDPNPSYYSRQNFPPSEKKTAEKHLYILAKKHINCFQDIIIRHARQIGNETNQGLEVFAGQMTYQNEPRQCVRINATDTTQLPILLSKLAELDVQLINNKKVTPYTSLIFYKKFIEFIQIEEGVYADKNNKNRFFFAVDKQLDYAELSTGIQIIKNNCNYHLFDAFLASAFVDNMALDFVGIYSDHCDKNRFGELKENIKRVYK
ncbi:MAG: hypothetical protein KAH17_09070 [Bacteroidales bacterium]|nr:hypothetical protein [Bacteroidales bacterium]